MTDANAHAPIVRAMHVQQTPADAFRIFTDEIGAWWPLHSHGMFGAESGGLIFDDERLVEVSTNGSESIWGEVIEWDEPNRLRFTWHPGQDATQSSEVEVEFIADGNGTRVVLEHRGWEAFGTEAAARRRDYIGPGAWGHVLDHFADCAEGRPDAADLTELRSSYEHFFDEAAQGGFYPPTNGQWTAEQVVAHVTLNDAAMLAVCQAMIHQEATRFENSAAQSPENLQRWIDRHGGLKGLVAAGLRTSEQFMASVARLSAGQQQQAIHCYLVSDGEAMLDDERPWSAIAVDVQAAFHLPSHTAQLAELRSAEATPSAST